MAREVKLQQAESELLSSPPLIPEAEIIIPGMSCLGQINQQGFV